jgi:hypothetical protein
VHFYPVTCDIILQDISENSVACSLQFDSLKHKNPSAIVSFNSNFLVTFKITYVPSTGRRGHEPSRSLKQESDTMEAWETLTIYYPMLYKRTPPQTLNLT